MESENVDIDQVPGTEETNLNKTEAASSHALGLQDLYKAAFSQETVNNFNNFSDKTTSITTIAQNTDLIAETSEKYYEENEKIVRELEKSEIIYKSPNFDESYQLYTFKGLQYSVDFVKPQENSLELNNLNYEGPKVDKFEGEEVLPSATVLNHPYESFQNDANSVLDLDKGIQIHFVKPDGTPASVITTTTTTTTTNSSSSLTYNYENCEYTGDAQILHRYLCDSAFMKSDSGTISTPPIGTVTLNFVNKQNNNVPEKNFYDSDSVGVNPETLGVRFEDCDFNSSDSFASTESIIPKNITCPKCPKKFMFKSDLLRHDKYKHSVKPKLFCKYCNKEFVSQQNLLFHEKSHKKKRNSHKCEVCKKVFKKSAVLVKHMMKKHSKNAPFSCSQCGKIYTSQILLNNHFRKFHLSDSEKPFKCEICSKSFEKKQGLSCHAKAHLDEHPYVCQHCNKTFSKICYLKNHQKSHSNEEKDSFVCDACGKDFKSSSALEEHSRKHTGEKPFTCNVCMKSFAYKAYFKVHIKKHAEVKPYSCSYCQKTFVTSTDLNKHERSHTKEKPYHCVNCNQDFSQQSNLITHLKKQRCQGNKSQEVCTQTIDFEDATMPNMTLQNVNVIVDPSFGTQQPIVLTSIGSFINSNAVPVILTQNPSGVGYSVPSIT